MEITKLGSIYFDGNPFEIYNKYSGETLSIGNTVKGKEITWVNVSGLLVADHTICVGINWDTLHKQGFIFGKKISIDGNPYLCRSLKVGIAKGVPNEWDNILNATNKYNSPWHCKGIFFWGQERSKLDMSCRSIRGFYSARYYSFAYPSDSPSPCSVRIGFRPALEPLVPDSLISDSLVGTTIKVYGGSGTISGTLSGFTDYDLYLSPAADNTQICDYPWCSHQEDGTISINRSAVVISKGGI